MIRVSDPGLLRVLCSCVVRLAWYPLVIMCRITCYHSVITSDDCQLKKVQFPVVEVARLKGEVL